jgi:hypothetical protein
MKNSWAARVLVGLACAGAMACGGSDGANDDRPRNSESRASSPDTAAAAIVSLSGCLEAAPGTDRYVLRNVRFEPRAEGDSQRTTTTPGGHGITEGAWVRLDRGETNLQDLLGQRVRLTGAVTDDGRNTIGTAGTTGVETPSGDKSQAASQEHHSDKVKKEAGRMARESMADGTAALVRVQEANGTGDRCTPH